MPPAIQDGAPNGYAGPGSLDGKTPGYYYINLKDTGIWPRYALPTLTFHEGIPGHIWQGEYTFDLPLIRTLLSFNAYTEGWGLYAEQIGDELGFYEGDPLGRIGYLQSMNFRAARLVVDTGLHHKRWTMAQAKQFFRAATGYTESQATSELNRYCIWPGQALGYKTGHNEINRLRAAAQDADGRALRLARVQRHRRRHRRRAARGAGAGRGAVVGRGLNGGVTMTRRPDDFTRRDLTFLGKTRPMLTMGSTGPAVVVLHEAYGITPNVERFCRWLVEARMRAYAPVLIGTPDATNPPHVGFGRILRLCIGREFTMFAADRSSPVVDWLKPLARLAHEECGGPGVGVVGMCLTGGFALSMAVDPSIVASVLSQPSLPVGKPAALDITPADLACVKQRTERGGLTLRGYRFAGDTLSRSEKFDTLRTVFGPAFTGVTLPDEIANPRSPQRRRGKPPHSVLTDDVVDLPGQPTRANVDEVIGFLREHLAVA